VPWNRNPFKQSGKVTKKRGFAAVQQAVLSTCHNLHVRIVAYGLHSHEEAKSPMSMQEHLVELKARHRELEDEIADAIAHPSTDDAKIAELKRRKLLVKDEIARMQASSSIH
jgi:hypothetical protein